ncbi:MAG: hypothetical protein GFH25_541182n17 [Chloroflexi bacterium AL-N10]|nr:hypothetical protein [Chloroflexi bacterium AL-N10]
MHYTMTLYTRSETTFGRGEGLTGLVDIEIEHDTAGCPFIGGRVLKGLLVEECVTIAYALSQANAWQSWEQAARLLFGKIGATIATTEQRTAAMHVGAATLPPELRNHLHTQVQQKKLTAQEVLTSLTTIRRQTSISAEYGAPEVGSLRAMRVLLRDTPMVATLTFDTEPDQQTLALLSACVLGVRRGGVSRNRGRGRLKVLLHEGANPPADYADATFTQSQFEHFAKGVRGGN